jgi:tRNA A-37 threonylcarbamoyl transferase component Bud32
MKNYCHPERFLYSKKTGKRNVNKVGVGKYGAVYVGCTNNSCAFRIAVKKSLDDMSREFAVLKLAHKADPKHVPKPYLVHECEPVGTIMYFEYIPSKTLDKYGTISKKTLYALLKTVYKINKAGIVHRDLHLNNILIENSTGTPYITDFGKAETSGKTDPRFDYHLILNILYHKLDEKSSVRKFIAKVVPKQYLSHTNPRVKRFRLRNDVDHFPELPSLKKVLAKLNVEIYK